MNELTHYIIESALGALILVFGFLLSRLVKDNDLKHRESDLKHREHFEHAKDMIMHETDRDRVALRDGLRLSADALLQHSQLDDRREDAQNERFRRVETKMDDMAKGIQEILIAVRK